MMRKHKRIIIGVLVALFSLSPLYAAEGQVLSLNQAKALAVENSSTLKDRALAYEQTMNTLGVSSFVPSLSLNSTMVLASLDSNSSTQYFNTTPSVNVNAGISWSLSSTDFYGKSKNRLNAENAVIDYNSAVESVKNSTEISYWNLVSLKYTVDQAENNLKAARSTLSRTQELYDASRSSELAYVQAQLSYSDSQLSLENARNNYSLALEAFCQSLGIDVVEDMAFDALPSVENIEISDEKAALLKNMLMESSTVKKAKNTERISQINANTSEMNAMAPVITLSTGVNYSAGVANEKTTDKYTGNATVNISIPLNAYIPGSQQNANVKNAEIDRQRAEITYASTINSLENKMDDALTAIKSLLANRGNLVSHLEYAQANLELVSEAYENGYASFADYEKAQSSLSSAQSQIDSNRFSIITRICSLAGILDTDAASIIEILER